MKHVKSMDLSRPVTIAIAQGYNTDKAVSIIIFNFTLSFIDHSITFTIYK